LRKVFECGDTIREGPNPIRGNFATEERDGWGAQDAFADIDDDAIRREAFKEDFEVFAMLFWGRTGHEDVVDVCEAEV